jgi:conjugal transfer pilus assembly protein TraF
MEAPKDAPPPEPVKPEAPAPLSASWFRVNLQKYMDKAIDNPTEENVEAYYLLQKVMMDKAEGFADMATKVVTGDKLLDETNRMSLDSATAGRASRIARDNGDEALKEISKSAGIFFFFSDECDLCNEQVRILREFERRYGMPVQPVSLDGSSLSNATYAQKTIQNKGQAERLGVESGGPALFLAKPPTQWMPLAFGIVNQSQLRERVFLAAEEAGMLPQEKFLKTKAVKPNRSLANKLQATEEVPEDPRELIELLRSLEN